LKRSGLYERILAPDRPPIRMLGLFDTVASVIESGCFGPRLKSHAFTSRNTSVESVSHAVATAMLTEATPLGLLLDEQNTSDSR
jgi:hypothetical protein